MGQDFLLPAINTEELKSVWNLLEHRISAPEPPDNNCANQFDQQSTKFTQLDSTMAPKIRGRLPDATKYKA